MRIHLIITVLLANIFLALPLFAGDKKDGGKPAFDKKQILAKANIENGKAIYDTGTPLNGVHITFNGGPHWMRTERTGCSTCHGPAGQGHIMPDFCTMETPGITVRHLEHTGYTMRSLDRALVVGYKLDGQEMDYCMPRWKLKDENLLDLVGYLISLGNK